MKFRPSQSEEPELNLVPLIDVLLMTLIFLVVTTSFSKEAQLRIQLPEATAEEKVNDNALRVVIDAKGNYYINNKQILKPTAAVLRNALSQAAGKNKNPIVVIHADENTSHQAVVRVMDSARRLGFTNLTFAIQWPDGVESSK